MRRGILLLILLLSAGGFLTADAVEMAKPVGIEAVTRPNYDAELSFPLQGRIGKILVKPGQSVKKGEILVQMEDDVEQARAKSLKAEADNVMQVNAARLQWEQKKLDYERLIEVSKKGGATKMEVEHARLDAKIQELSVHLAEFNRAQAKTEHQQAVEQLKRMQIVAPVDGVVDSCFVEVGQSVDRAMKVVRLVNVDPVWIDVPVPIAIGATLKVGQKATVVFDSAKGETAAGTIIHISLVADSASETRMVRVSVANPKNRPAGMRVWVQFPK